MTRSCSPIGRSAFCAAAIIAVSACFGVRSAASAQFERHITITVEQVGTGKGDKIAFLLRERFRQSALFRYTDQKKDAGYILHLNSLGGNKSVSGLTIYSVTITMKDIRDVLRGDEDPSQIYVDSISGYCGDDIIDQCANDLYVSLGDWIDKKSVAENEALRRSLETFRSKTAPPKPK